MRDKTVLKDKVANLAMILRSQNNGADIHTVLNMRQVAEWLLRELEDDSDVEIEFIEAQTKHLEKKVVDFFTKKYHPWH